MQPLEKQLTFKSTNLNRKFKKFQKDLERSPRLLGTPTFTNIVVEIDSPRRISTFQETEYFFNVQVFYCYNRSHFSQAASRTDANEGVLFMQEMVELSKTQSTENIPQAVSFTYSNKTTVLNAGPANFGKLLRSDESVS
jgi:hypothetical protein